MLTNLNHRTISKAFPVCLLLFTLASAHAALAFPEESPESLPVGPDYGTKTSELENGVTISSLVTQIIQHGDLRDSAFIGQIFGWHQNSFYYYDVTIPHTKLKSGFHVTYPAPPPPPQTTTLYKSNSYAVASILFYSIPQKLCIKYTDFQSHFPPHVEERPGILKQSILHVYKKKLKTGFTLSLEISTVDSCADDILIYMDKTSRANLKGE